MKKKIKYLDSKSVITNKTCFDGKEHNYILDEKFFIEIRGERVPCMPYFVGECSKCHYKSEHPE